MFRSFIMLTARNLVRNRLHTVSNVAGVALASAFAIAIVTVGHESLAAALANPADSLRYE